VPIYVFDPSGSVQMKLANHTDLGISSIAATCLKLLGFEPPQDYTPSIIELC
jgi:2,3-bisphosphoglycerate-independent phosphoglycerate mutase